MKFKRFMTILILSFLSITGVFFGCKNKYEDFRIEINGDSVITLRESSVATDDKPSSYEVEIKLINAPDDSCRNLSYSFSRVDIVDVVEIESSHSDIKRFKITARDSITTFNPSTIITFTSIASGKSCSVTVNVEIPMGSIKFNSAYDAYCVTGGETYFIDSSKAFTFLPKNTTQRELVYSLVDETGTLAKNYGVKVSEAGGISIENYFYKASETSGQVAIPSTISVKATSKFDETKSETFSVRVLRDISYDDVKIAYGYNMSQTDIENGDFTYSFTKASDKTVSESYEGSLDQLLTEGIKLASNKSERKSVDFGVFLSSVSGLDFNKMEIVVARTSLQNCIIENNNLINDNTQLRAYKIFASNPGNDIFVLTIKYKGIDKYSKSFIIPISVLEYPRTLTVNDSIELDYNIYDFYGNTFNGQEFNVQIEKSGAYDKTFKVEISEEDFNLIEVRYKNELLDYQTLTNFVFDNKSSIFVKAKQVNELGAVSLSFVSSSLNEFSTVEERESLSKTVNLSLIPGIRSVKFAKTLTDGRYYLQSGKSLNVNFLVNDLSTLDLLNGLIDFEIEGQNSLVEIEYAGKDYFTVKSNGEVGEVKFHLISENGIATETRRIVIYNGNSVSGESFELDLESENIKTVQNGDEIKYYLGVKNSANINVLNPQNSTIYDVEISSSEEDAIKATILDDENLMFNLYAYKIAISGEITISVRIWVYNDNDLVNEQLLKDPIELSFKISTYTPLSTVEILSKTNEVIDSEALDYDSSQVKKLDVLDVSKIIKLTKDDNDFSSVKVNYIFPSQLEGVDAYELIENENSPFKNIKFSLGKNKNFKFVDGKYAFGLTVQIFDLADSETPAYEFSLSIIVKQKVDPEEIRILNDLGYVYIENGDTSTHKVLAEVISKTSEEVTNGSLVYEAENNDSIEIDAITGEIRAKAAGITKVTVKASASRYDKNGQYSVVKDLFVVVADGSEKYPLIMDENTILSANKYYTLNKNIEINKSIDVKIAGLSGQFAYLEWTTLKGSTVEYSLVFSGEGSVFEVDELTANLKDITIIYNANQLEVKENFGLISEINNGDIENVKLIVNTLFVKNSSSSSVLGGTMFAQNNSKIASCVVLAQNGKGKIVLTGSGFNFGGLVGENNGEISGEYNYISKKDVTSVKLDIQDLSLNGETIVAGAVAKNNGEISGVKAEVAIRTSAKFVGGIIGQNLAENKTFKNLYFTGNLLASETSTVGGICAKNEKENSFRLVFVEFIGNSLSDENNVFGSVVGGLIAETTANVSVKYAFVISFSTAMADLKGELVAGIIAKASGETNLVAVYSGVNIAGTKTGAIVGEVENISLIDVYSYSSGTNGLVYSISNTMEISDVYSTTCEYVINEIYDNDSAFVQQKISEKSLCLKNNWQNVINNSNFNDDNYFRYNQSINGGLPYLVYNETDGYRKLLTIVANTIDAKFNVKNNYSNGLEYGISENIIVVSSDGLLNKALVFYENGLVFDIDNLLSITSTPQDADLGLEFYCDNENVIKILNGQKLQVVGIGDAKIEIRERKNSEIKCFVYISVVEKVKSFVLGKYSQDFVISKGSSKQFDFEIDKKVENNGIGFNFEEDVSEKILINNQNVEDMTHYCFDEKFAITGLTDLSKTNVCVALAYKVNFGEQEMFVLDRDYSKVISLSVVSGATMISSHTNAVNLTESETIDFDVYVGNDNLASGGLLFESIDGDVDINEYFDFNYSIKDISGNISTYNVEITSKLANVSEDKNFEIKIYHTLNSEIYDEDMFTTISIRLKSSILKSIELNHYSSKIQSTIGKSSEFEYVLNNETMPSTDIVKGNFGVLNINLYPSFANVTDIEVQSSIVNGNRIYFNQLDYNENNNLVIVPHAGNTAQGISLKINKDTIRANGGNLFVSTLLSSNIAEDTVFAITVICYNGLKKYEPVSINLKAKALTTIVLTNEEKKSSNYLAKGSDISFDINCVNMTSDFEVTKGNFEIEAKNNYTSEELKKYVNWSVENNKLVVSCDILTKSGTNFTLTPIFKTTIGGVVVESKGTPVNVLVVDYVVLGISVENLEDGILINNPGVSTKLFAKLDVKMSDAPIFGDEKYDEKMLEYNNLLLKIRALEEVVSKNNYSWNLITNSSNGTTNYNNIKDKTTYSNFSVYVDENGYYNVLGKNISENKMIVRANIAYENGLVSLDKNANDEVSLEFVINIKTQSSQDNPIPITSYEDLVEKLADGEDYILLNDITLPAEFAGINTKIASFDGNNKVINMQAIAVENASQKSLGLFNEIASGTVIKNVTINILPSLYYTDTYNYGLSVNAQELSELNFGVLCGTNNGVITNCHVVNNNYRLVNGENIYENVNIYVNSGENVDLKVGGLVGENNGYITSSSVGNIHSQHQANSITISAKAKIGGLVCENSNKIASSYAANIVIYNNSVSKLTGGFVAENTTGAKIITSYVQGITEKPSELVLNAYPSENGILANGYVGGFATVNAGSIKDCYSYLKITTNKRSAGFVYDNTNGTVETCLSLSCSNENQSFRAFTGNDEENITLDNGGIKYCYYLTDSDINGGEGEFDERANGISAMSDATYFEGFICDGSSSSIWSFGGKMPRLVDADREIISERKLIDETLLNENVSGKYEYIYINNVLGSINNPIVASTTKEFFNALTNEQNLYSYYYGGKIVKTKVNYKHISLASDIDLSKIIDISSEYSTQSEVQKLQDIIFAGNLNGNGMEISNITITAKNQKTNYSSFGLFKQIGVELNYSDQGKIENSKLDEDICSTIKNLDFEIEAISATITKSVGSLSGEVLNSKLYNINVYSTNSVVVTGKNMVGAIAGRISGKSFVKGVSSNLSVLATNDEKTSDETYNISSTKRIYKNSGDILQDSLNDNVSIVGGLFGVVDIYETKISSFVQNNDISAKSYYVTADIDRENDYNVEKAHIQFSKVYGNLSVSGKIVGGLFGYVTSKTIVYDAKFVLNESGTQNLIAEYAVGGISGINEGYITYATVELELEKQREVDQKEDYDTSYLFSNEKNTADYVGGLVGILRNGMLSYSYAKVNIVAPNSEFVGSVCGAFSDARIEYVYAISLLEAQKEVNVNGLVTQNKGYASAIANLASFENQSVIDHVVSILRNKNISNDFYLSGIVGYNYANDVKIDGSEFSKITSSENGELVTNYGKTLDGEIKNSSLLKDYILQASNTFVGYNSKESWTKTYGLDTFYRLTYNKKGAIREIGSEDELRNMLLTGTAVLTKDIYLTDYWEPLSEFRGTLRSAQKPDGTYYKIYNLNIQAKGNQNNVGFFISTENATIENIDFVVGSRYKDPENGSEPTEIDSVNWPDEKVLGINVKNSYIDGGYLGTISAKSEGTTFRNVNVKFEKSIVTNLAKAGAFVGLAKNCTFEKITIDGARLQETEKIKSDVSIGLLCAELVGDEKNYVREISFKNENILSFDNLDKRTSGTQTTSVKIGGVFGSVSGGFVKDCNLKLLKDNKIKIQANVTNTTNMFVGVLAGSSSNGTYQNIILDNFEINVKGQDIGYGYVAGFVGQSVGDAILDTKILSENNVEYEYSSTKGDNRIGGVSGYSTGGKIENLYISSSIAINSGNVASYVGGIIGLNGQSLENNFATKLTNVLSKQKISFVDNKENPIEGNNLQLGGLIGSCYNKIDSDTTGGVVQNSAFVGKILSKVSAISDIGGLVGSGKNDICDKYSFFVEDLTNTPKRSEENGKAESYSNFVNNVSKIIGKTSNELKNIENGEMLVNLFELIKLDSEEIILSTENSEKIESITSGSIYNPNKIYEKLDTITGAKTIVGASVGADLGEENKFYLLTSNISLSASFVSVKGNVFGNGETIILSGKNGFAKEICENAMISGVVFAVASGTNDTYEYNQKEFSKFASSFVIAQTNNGLIYNSIVAGDIMLESEYFSPICVTNNGIVNVVTNFAHILAKRVASVQAELADSVVTGFVYENNGMVYNSTSVGNLEAYTFTGDTTVRGNVEINAQNINEDGSGNRLYAYGFVAKNNRTMINCVSSLVLPKLNNGKNQAFVSGLSGKFVNCVVDRYSTNGYEKFNDAQYKFNRTDEISKNIKTLNSLGNLWTDENINYAYGYSIPKLSVNVEFGNDVLKTSEIIEETISETIDGTATEAKVEKTYYKVNNFGSMTKIVNAINENRVNSDGNIVETIVENGLNAEEICIKQVASMRATVDGTNDYEQNNCKTVTPINLKKQLNYLGNNMIIYDTKISSSDDLESKKSYVGLFYSTNNANIKISSLALSNISTNYVDTAVKTSKTGSQQIENLYIGALVAYTDGKVELFGCYVNGDFNIEKNDNIAKDWTKANNLIVGGFVGYAKTAMLENNVNDVDILLDNLDAYLGTGTEATHENQYKKYGYTAYVGGAVGQTDDGTILGGYSLGLISCGSVKELYMGGIVGNISGGNVENNVVLAQISYRGAYLSNETYKVDLTKKLSYNKNAVVGYATNATFTGNVYNELLNLVGDEIINLETNLTETVTEKNKNNENVTIYKIEKIVNAMTTIENAFSNTQVEKSLLNEGRSYIVPAPSITISDNTTIAPSNNEMLIANCAENSIIEFSTSHLEDKKLENAMIIFVNPCVAKISGNIFDKLNNCVIANLIIEPLTEQTILSTPAIANEIENTRLNNVTIRNCYFSLSGENGGAIAGIARNSVLENVKNENGRVSGDSVANFGGLVGYAGNSLFENCSNFSTITNNNAEENVVHTAGIVGFGENSYAFGCINSGLVYSKTINTDYSSRNSYTSGIMNGQNSTVSFSKNEETVKGVNTTTNSHVENHTGGIATNSKVYYSVNESSVVSIGGANGLAGDVAAGITTKQSVFYSYHIGAVVSRGYVYAISSANIYRCFNIGGGYAAMLDIEIVPLSGSSISTSFNIDQILATTEATQSKWYEKFSELPDMTVATSGNLIIPTINLFGEIKVLELVDGKYQISKPFELWYWSQYAYSDNKNVEITNDIDMTGFTYRTVPSYSGTFDGKYHTISNLKIDGVYVNGIDLYYGLIGANTGTIQNIYFENPSIKTDEAKNLTKEPISNNYIAIVSAINSGTIQNILVASTDSQVKFIDFVYSTDEAFSDIQAFFAIGTIAGRNSLTGVTSGSIEITGGIIENCEVINMGNNSIEYSISQNKKSTFIANDLYVYTGGIVGENCSELVADYPSAGVTSRVNGRVLNNVFIGRIEGTVKNFNMFGLADGAGDVGQVIGETVLYGYYSKAWHSIGQIVGSGTVGENYTLLGDKNEFVYMYTENLQNNTEVGEKITGGGIGRFALSYLRRRGGKLIKSITLKPVMKKMGKLILKIGVPDPTDLIDVFLFLMQEAVNSVSFSSVLNKSGCVKTSSIPSVSGFENLDIESEYINIFSDGMDNSAKNYVYNNYVELIGNKNTNTDTKNKVPFIREFLNLSSTQTIPTNVEISTTTNSDGSQTITATAFVYDENELVYALTNTNFNVKNSDGTTIKISKFDKIVLMDHIDFSNKIWDGGLLDIVSGITIVDNGFKIIYGASNSTSFKDEFINVYSSLKNVLVEEIESEKTQIDEDVEVDSYGKFSKVEKNKKKVAYELFEARFKKAWVEGYQKETGSTPNKANEEYNNLLTKFKKEYGTNDIYILQYSTQCEILADALIGYTVNNLSHTPIDFNGKTFVLNGDIDLTQTQLYSLDIYNYKMVSGFYYNIETGAVVEATEQEYQESSKLDCLFETPSFVLGSDKEKYCHLSGETLEFNGTIVGTKNAKAENGLFTITTANKIFTILGDNAKIENFKVNFVGKNVETNFCDSTGELTSILNAIVVLENRGIMKGIQLECENSLNYIYNFEFADIVNNFKKLDDDSYALEANVAISSALFAATNSGTIESCELVTKDINITEQFNIAYSITTTSIERPKTNIDEETKYFNIGKTSATESGSVYDNDVVNKLKLSSYFGVISAQNSGRISDIAMKNKTINLTPISFNIETIGGERKEIVNDKEEIKKYVAKISTDNITLSSFNAGLICGMNLFDHNFNFKNPINSNGIYNSTIYNSSLNLNYENGILVGKTNSDVDVTKQYSFIYAGLIAGYTSGDIKTTYLINSNLNCTYFENKTEKSEVQVGQIVGLATPTVYKRNLSFTIDEKTMSCGFYTSHIPEISDYISNKGTDFIGKVNVLAINKEEKSENGESISGYVLYNYAGANEFDTENYVWNGDDWIGMGAVDYYFELDSSGAPVGFSAKLDDNDYLTISGAKNQTTVPIYIACQKQSANELVLNAKENLILTNASANNNNVITQKEKSFGDALNATGLNLMLKLSFTGVDALNDVVIYANNGDKLYNSNLWIANGEEKDKIYLSSDKSKYISLKLVTSTVGKNNEVEYNNFTETDLNNKVLPTQISINGKTFNVEWGKREIGHLSDTNAKTKDDTGVVYSGYVANVKFEIETTKTSVNVLDSFDKFVLDENGTKKTEEIDSVINLKAEITVSKFLEIEENGGIQFIVSNKGNAPELGTYKILFKLYDDCYVLGTYTFEKDV